MRKIGRNHTENREKLCIWCFKKTPTMKNISTMIEKSLNSFDQNLSTLDERLPKKVCGSCYNNFNFFQKNNDEKTREKILKLKATTIINQILSIRRNRTDQDVGCNCTLCKIITGRSNGFDFKDDFLKNAVQQTKQKKKIRKSFLMRKVWVCLFFTILCFFIVLISLTGL